MANNEVPTIQQSERVETSATALPFGQAASGYAAAANSGIGADIALKAAVARSELSGIELGKDPKGDLLPAFTKADEAFNNAYRNQARATLSLEADKFMSQGLDSLNQANRLTPELIDGFNNNTIAGIDEIVSLAPKQDQEALRNAFSSQLLQTNEKLNNKLAAQQKAEQLDTFNNYTTQENINMFNAAADGNESDAKRILNNITASNNAAAEAGLISKTDATNANEAARINYLTSKTYSKALSAIDSKTLPEFLSDFGKHPPKDMTPNEYVQVSKGLLQLVNLKESTESRNQSLIMSEANVAVQMNQMTSGMLAELKETLEPDNYNKVLVSYAIQDQKRKDELDSIQHVYNNMGNAGALSQVDGKIRDKAYINQVNDLLKNNPGMDPFMAKSFVASNTAAPIPAYIKEFNAKATSGLAQNMQQALSGMKAIGEKFPASADGITPDARNMLTLFEQGLGAYDSETSAQLASKSVLGLDESERKKRKENLEFIHKRYFSTDDKDKSKGLIKGAKAISGMDPYTASDPIGFSLMAQNTFDINYLAMGDESAAVTRTQEQIAKRYAQSYANTIGRNKPRLENYPVDKALGASKQQLPIVNNMIAESAFPYMQKFNANSTVYEYKFKEGSFITSTEYLAAKREESEIVFGFKGTDSTKEVQKQLDRLNVLRPIVKSYENMDRPVVERIDKVTGEKQEYFLGTNLQNDGTLMGNAIYDIKLINMNGRIENFLGMDNIGGAHFIANPNQFEFNMNNYMKVLNSGGKAPVEDTQQLLQKEAEKRRLFVAEKMAKDGFYSSNKPVSENPTADYPRTMRVATGKTVENGRQVYQNADGTVSTELSITVTDERLNEGKPTNIPSLWDGMELSEDESILRALESGNKYESFKSIEDAVDAAEKKSYNLGKETKKMSQDEVIRTLFRGAIKNGATMNEIYMLGKKKGLTKEEIDTILGNTNE